MLDPKKSLTRAALSDITNNAVYKADSACHWSEEIAASPPFTFYFTSTHRGSETLVR